MCISKHCECLENNVTMLKKKKTGFSFIIRFLFLYTDRDACCMGKITLLIDDREKAGLFGSYFASAFFILAKKLKIE